MKFEEEKAQNTSAQLLRCVITILYLQNHIWYPIFKEFFVFTDIAKTEFSQTRNDEVKLTMQLVWPSCWKTFKVDIHP